MGWVSGPDLKLQKGALNANALEGLPVLTFLRDSLVYRDVVDKFGGTARISPISSIAAMVSLIKSGYGIATLPYAAIAREVKAGDLIWYDVEPQLAPVPIIASLRSQSDSPLAETLVPLAKQAAETFLSGLHAEAVSRKA
jgi:DNA-binding transcriptional LysR family regulator